MKTKSNLNRKFLLSAILFLLVVNFSLGLILTKESTDALYQASLGKPSVDKVPYEDSWGRFYSAYSPVFDSNGKVAGIVAVDFSADWYDKQIRTQADQ